MALSARALIPALALTASCLLAPVRDVRAGPPPDPALVASSDSVFAGRIGRGQTVMTYGPASDSIVRARCEGAPIRQVEIRCLDIFDPVPASRFAAFYRGANRLHVRTRQATVRSQLLIAPEHRGQRFGDI